MQNVKTSDNESVIGDKIILTVNEVKNALGENYKTVAKALNTLATQGKIQVTEKYVNNRPLKGYILSISDIQSIKDSFQKKGAFYNSKIKDIKQMVTNALNTSENEEISEINKDDKNVKFYEVVKENAELTKELEKLKTDMQIKINENVRLDADLSMARSELKFIEDKKSFIEGENSKQKIEIERLNRNLKVKNTAIITLSAILLIILTVTMTLYLIKHI